MSAAIAIEGVTRSYGAGPPAVDGISLLAPAGAVTALLGPSGSGKSTLLKIVAGLEPIDAGTVRIGTHPVSQPGFVLPPERRGVGLVFQDYALFPHLTAAQNVAFGIKAHDRAAKRAEALAWLERIGLAHRADAYPHALSGGEQQRVALARALASSPQAVLLDEPFSGLDPLLRAALRDATLAALRAASATAIFVTHDADEALYVSDHLAILKAGRLVQAGGPREVYDHPLSIDAAAALGPVNTAAGRCEGGVVQTPFGAVSGPGLEEGAPALAAVRAEAVRLGPGDAAQVVDRRPQGALDLFRLQADGLIWRALGPARGGPKPGDRIGVMIDPNGAFAFPGA